MDETNNMSFFDILVEIFSRRRGNRTAIDPVVQDIVDKEVDKLLKGNIESLINATDVGQGVIVFHTAALRSFWENMTGITITMGLFLSTGMGRL